MKLTVTKQFPGSCATEAIIVGHYEESTGLRGAAGELDEAGGGLLSSIISGGDFSGKFKDTALVYTGGALPAKRVLLVGLGREEDLTDEKVRVAFAGAARRIRDIKVKECALSSDFGSVGSSPEGPITAVVEGMLLGLYRYTPYKTKTDDTDEIQSVSILCDRGPGDRKAMARAVREARILCDAVYLARDLVSAPANEMTPALLAREARRLEAIPSLSVKVIEAATMKRMGMHALLGVGGGSCNPPKLVVMEYRGGKPKAPPVVIVGKGITFDSGGLSLKPPDSMVQMKDDMAGAAAVMGTLKAVAELKLPVNVIGLVPAAENLPDGCACRPGDILRSLSGRTIEIISTDAEGRLVLADALTYAKRFKPAAIIDIATLTGACVIALGDNLAGLFSNDKPLRDRLMKASERTGEALWELPLWEEYDDLIKSDTADMKNTGTRAGGAITAALFLKKFIETTPWAHLDIAGPAFAAKERGYIPKGASGAGVRLLVQMLCDWT
ncbi:MAG: leucyl aminopeptidase [Syntrophales bacterium]|jgi:leucyl aminopeptidase|nr:leucyl aminopeptidase [Syntrophales bacterium]MCK9528324.1 leucyl aminopeptidase [Syntrophales bacterium]MDX9922163.1 leucyl aminopeptidase [Syntrophales bacterium]